MSIGIFNDPGVAGWINSLGYLGVAAVVFAETAFFFCFFLPGDSLLFTAGMLAATHMLNIFVLIPLLIVAAFLGYVVGYYIGFYFGHRLAKRPDTWYYKKRYAVSAHVFMQKYGRLALLLGRMIAVVRTFIPMIAGMGEMPIFSYMVFNFLGAILWCVSIPLLGFYLGRIIPNMENYFSIVIIGIVAVSILPGIIEWWRKKRESR